MNTKYFLLIACIVACFTSCRQTVSPTESHQVETILELFDSLTARGENSVRYLECKDDSILSEQYLQSQIRLERQIRLTMVIMKDGAKRRSVIIHSYNRMPSD